MDLTAPQKFCLKANQGQRSVETTLGEAEDFFPLRLSGWSFPSLPLFVKHFLKSESLFSHSPFPEPFMSAGLSLFLNVREPLMSPVKCVAFRADFQAG